LVASTGAAAFSVGSALPRPAAMGDMPNIVRLCEGAAGPVADVGTGAFVGALGA
jgi:hypothetical protein